VATEVRTLASRSAAAAKEIRSLSNVSADKVRLGSVKVNLARDAMDSIVDSIQRVTLTLGEIHAGSNLQNTSMTNITMAVNQLDQMTQQNAAVVEESAAAAQNLQDQAGGLRHVAGQFRLPGLMLSTQ
jgi:methyl-accepting chemotaxis protein